MKHTEGIQAFSPHFPDELLCRSHIKAFVDSILAITSLYHYIRNKG